MRCFKVSFAISGSTSLVAIALGRAWKISGIVSTAGYFVVERLKELPDGADELEDKLSTVSNIGFDGRRRLRLNDSPEEDVEDDDPLAWLREAIVALSSGLLSGGVTTVEESSLAALPVDGCSSAWLGASWTTRSVGPVSVFAGAPKKIVWGE